MQNAEWDHGEPEGRIYILGCFRAFYETETPDLQQVEPEFSANRKARTKTIAEKNQHGLRMTITSRPFSRRSGKDSRLPQGQMMRTDDLKRPPETETFCQFSITDTNCGIINNDFTACAPGPEDPSPPQE